MDDYQSYGATQPDAFPDMVPVDNTQISLPATVGAGSGTFEAPAVPSFSSPSGAVANQGPASASDWLKPLTTGATDLVKLWGGIKQLDFQQAQQRAGLTIAQAQLRSQVSSATNDAQRAQIISDANVNVARAQASAAVSQAQALAAAAAAGKTVIPGTTITAPNEAQVRTFLALLGVVIAGAAIFQNRRGKK